MIKITNIDEFRAYIQKDSEMKDSRFPARFILINDFEIWNNVISFLKNYSDAIIFLSNYCKGDHLPYVNKIRSEINSIKSDKVLILPLSEYIRFNQSDIIRYFALLENIGSKRYYIPLFGLDDIFIIEMEKLSRFKSKELPDPIKIAENSPLKIIISTNQIPIQNFTIIQGMDEYFKKWEINIEKDLIVITEIAKYLKMEDIYGNLSVKIYRNAFEILKSYILNTGFFNIEMGKREEWDWLLNQIKVNENFGDFCCRILNVYSYDHIELSKKWNSYPETHKWLFWLWSNSQPSDSYFFNCIKKTKNYHELLNILDIEIFNLYSNEPYRQERLHLLNNLKAYERSNAFWTLYSDTDDPFIKLNCLSSLSNQEQIEIIKQLKQISDEATITGKILSIINSTFPEIPNYLDNNLDNDDLKNYFSQYNFSKLLDCPTNDLHELTKKYAKEKIILSFPTRNSLLERYYKNAKIFWIDGLGLEWYGLLKFFLSKIINIDFKIIIARANLPSDTKHNKGWMNDDDVEGNLDKIGHHYDYPGSFIDQITQIQQIFVKINKLLEFFDELVITSDHGLTRFSNSGETIELKIDAKIGPWGRYLCSEKSNLNSNCYDNSKFIIENNCIYLATHDKFKGGSGFFGDIHGGATIEEVLIPIIHIKKIPSSDEINIELLTPIIDCNAHGIGYIKIRIDKEVKEVVFIINKVTIKGVSISNKIWQFEIKGFQSGIFESRIVVDQLKSKKIKVEIRRGISERDMKI